MITSKHTHLFINDIDLNEFRKKVNYYDSEKLYILHSQSIINLKKYYKIILMVKGLIAKQ